MERCRRLLVALKLNEQDTAVIRYAATLSHMAASRELHFVHVVQKLELPADVRQRYPQLHETPPELARRQLAERVQPHFEGHRQPRLNYEVLQGCPILELAHYARDHRVDLTILGRASLPVRLGQISQRLARKAPCCVLIVPENSKPKISAILVPVDFSSHAADALDLALALARLGETPRVDCLHAFRVPPEYERTGTSYEQFAEEMRKSSLASFAALAARCDPGQVAMSTDVVLDRNPAHAIGQVLQRGRHDLVVMGARGQSPAGAVLLGSITEHVIWTTNIPVLVVREKGANAAFLSALLQADKNGT